MENFKKTVQNEAWNWEGNKEESEKFVQQQLQRSRKSKETTEQAIMNAVANVREELLNMYDNEYESVQDIVDDESTDLDIGELKVRLNRSFGDEYANITGFQAVEAAEEDMLKMFDALDVLDDDEEDELMPSDMEDPPGFMPGEGGNY